MKNNWNYYNPVRIYSGRGLCEKLDEFIPATGQILLVTSPGFTRRGVTSSIINQLGIERVKIFDQVMPNPQLDKLDDSINMLSKFPIKTIIAIGGGSVLDTGKIFSITLPCKIDRPLHRIFSCAEQYDWQVNLPLIVVPTTSGTGAEVTPFATVWGCP